MKAHKIAQESTLTKDRRLRLYLAEVIKVSNLEKESRDRLNHYLLSANRHESLDENKATVYTKYKPVAKKIRPLHAELPDEYRIIRD